MKLSKAPFMYSMGLYFSWFQDLKCLISQAVVDLEKMVGSQNAVIYGVKEKSGADGCNISRHTCSSQMPPPLHGWRRGCHWVLSLGPRMCSAPSSSSPNSAGWSPPGPHQHPSLHSSQSTGCLGECGTKNPQKHQLILKMIVLQSKISLCCKSFFLQIQDQGKLLTSTILW